MTAALCGGRLSVYDREFARLRGVVLMDRRLASATRRGGESLDSVLGQPESYELYHLGRGFFVVSDCDGVDSTPPPTVFHRNNYLNDWMTATRLQPPV